MKNEQRPDPIRETSITVVLPILSAIYPAKTIYLKPNFWGK